MGSITGNDIHLNGNFARLGRRRPKNWIDRDYKILVKYPFKWREKIGKTECTCAEVEEHHQPYYGTSWFHTANCALMQRLKTRPQLMNLPCYAQLPLLETTED